jgi:hypothetical protein
MTIEEDIFWADVIVIGAGPSGLMSSKAAQEAGLKVLLIDAGLMETDIYSSLLDRNNVKHKSGGIGGASINWGAQCVLPSDYDLDKWISSLHASKTYLDLVNQSINSTSIFLNLPIRPDGRYFDNEIENYSSKAKTKHSIYLRDGLLQNYFIGFLWNLRFVDNFAIKKLKIENGVVAGIYHFDNYYSVTNKKIILACGTLSSTSLINDSFYDGRSNIYPLQDHPHGYIASFSGRHPRKLRKAQIHKSKGSLYKRKFEFISHKLNQSAIFEFHYDLKGNQLTNFGLAEPNGFLFNLSSLINRISFKFMRRVFLKVPYIHVWTQIEQQKGPYILCEKGEIFSSWTLGESDRALVAELQEHVIDISRKMGLNLVWKPNLENMDFLGNFFVDAYHPSGTLKMSNDPAAGFVDEFGVVYSASNLLINSSAIWPTSGWFNPTFFQMVIAELNTRQFCKLND